MLNKLRRKLKQWLVCGNEFDNAVEDVMSRKISDDAKCALLFKLTSYYMNNYMMASAKFAAWENYYERIMVNGKEDKAIAKKYVEYEYGNFLYHTIYKVAKEVNKLKMQQPNRVCGLLEDFRLDVLELNPSAFYVHDSAYRTEQLTKANIVARAIDNYCKKDATTERVSIVANNYCLE